MRWHLWTKSPSLLDSPADTLTWMRLRFKSTNRFLRHLKRRTLAPRQSDAYLGKSATMHFQCGFPAVLPRLNWSSAPHFTCIASSIVRVCAALLTHYMHRTTFSLIMQSHAREGERTVCRCILQNARSLTHIYKRDSIEWPWRRALARVRFECISDTTTQ
jgi:hypothetical protein